MKILKMIAGGGMNDARELAEMVRRMGRGNDTILAHITPEEADLLRERGGSGKTNPMTGLPEFQQDYEYEAYYGGGSPTDYNYDVEAQQGGFYGETPTARYDPTRDLVSLPGKTIYQNPENVIRPSPNSYSSTGERVVAPVDDTDIGFGPGRYTPDVLPAEIAGASQAQLEAAYPGAFVEPGVLDTIEQLGRRAEQFTKERPTTTRLLAGGASVLGQALIGARARRQAQAQADELRRQAAPFRAAGEEALARAQGTGLTAAQQREMDIAQARARQGLSARNMGTGSAAAGMLSAQRQRAQSTAREQSFNEALRLAGIADKYTQDALRAEIDADSQLAQLLGNVIGREVQRSGQEQNVGQNQQQQRRS
jgi:hypothetical protein